MAAAAQRAVDDDGSGDESELSESFGEQDGFVVGHGRHGGASRLCQHLAGWIPKEEGEKKMLGRPGTLVFGTYPPVTAPQTLSCPGNTPTSLLESSRSPVPPITGLTVGLRRPLNVVELVQRL